MWNKLVHTIIFVTSLKTCLHNNFIMVDANKISSSPSLTFAKDIPTLVVMNHRNNKMLQHSNVHKSVGKEEGRIFFDAIGGLIMGSDFFPIEVNVPDTISAIGNGMGNMWNYMTGGVSSIYSNLIGATNGQAATATSIKKAKKKTPAVRKKSKKPRNRKKMVIKKKSKVIKKKPLAKKKIPQPFKMKKKNKN